MAFCQGALASCAAPPRGRPPARRLSGGIPRATALRMLRPELRPPRWPHMPEVVGLVVQVFVIALFVFAMGIAAGCSSRKPVRDPGDGRGTAAATATRTPTTTTTSDRHQRSPDADLERAL